MTEEYTKLVIRDLTLPVRIGIRPRELAGPQPVLINIQAFLDQLRDTGDDIARTVSYGEIVKGVRRLMNRGHIALVETLAEAIADICLEDVRVAQVIVRVEKTAFYEDIGGVGVEIRRSRAA